jgi:hypothetical protein
MSAVDIPPDAAVVREEPKGYSAGVYAGFESQRGLALFLQSGKPATAVLMAMSKLGV